MHKAYFWFLQGNVDSRVALTVGRASFLNGGAARRLGTAFAVWTGDHHHIPIGIAKPNLPVPGRRVDVRFFDDLRPQPASSLDDGVKIADLKPQQHAVSRRRRVWVDKIGVLLRIPGVQLKEQPARAPDPIVHVAMRVIRELVCSEQFGVPAAARANIAHCYERLSLDIGFLRGRAHEAVPFSGV
jgi:hypothetical protein